MQGQWQARYTNNDTLDWHASLAEINRGDSLALIAFGPVQIWREVIEVSVAQTNLHRFERVPVRHQATSERPSTSVTAVTGSEPCGTVQASHIALEAIGGQILDRFTLEIDAPLDAQLERATLLREDQPRSRHQATVLATIQRHPMSTAISPLDVAFEGLDRRREREKHAARPAAFGDRTGNPISSFLVPNFEST